jgi:hypothetical protein
VLAVHLCALPQYQLLIRSRRSPRNVLALFASWFVACHTLLLFVDVTMLHG